MTTPAPREHRESVLRRGAAAFERLAASASAVASSVSARAVSSSVAAPLARRLDTIFKFAAAEPHGVAHQGDFTVKARAVRNKSAAISAVSE